MPNAEYELLINVVSADDLIGNSSHFVRFVAPDGGKKEKVMLKELDQHNRTLNRMRNALPHH